MVVSSRLLVRMYLLSYFGVFTSAVLQNEQTHFTSFHLIGSKFNYKCILTLSALFISKIMFSCIDNYDNKTMSHAMHSQICLTVPELSEHMRLAPCS